MSYKNLEIWKMAREVVIEIHKMSLSLPKFEQYEEEQKSGDQAITESSILMVASADIIFVTLLQSFTAYCRKTTINNFGHYIGA